mmetsp:Transcript_23476/g.32756  ORF Transcript_23476/g.32756 Transcript_23476/m.32756 type:complete len:314 (+) Transcript_23476:374-1315(+)
MKKSQNNIPSILDKAILLKKNNLLKRTNKIRNNLKEYYNTRFLNTNKEDIQEDKNKVKTNKIFFGIVHHLKVGLNPYLKSDSCNIISQALTIKHSVDNLDLYPLNRWNQLKSYWFFKTYFSKKNFNFPLPIQSLLIPSILKGKDLICLAKTGSGKTLCYLLPLILRCIDQQDKNITRMIIIAPTRELVQQIGTEAYFLTLSKPHLTICMQGGSPIKNYLSSLVFKSVIIVCTPGKLLDLGILHKKHDMWNFRTLIIDEADKIFDLGFEIQIKRILYNARKDKQILLFSSCFPYKVNNFYCSLRLTCYSILRNQ